MSDYWKQKLDTLNKSTANSSSGYWKTKLNTLNEQERKKKYDAEVAKVSTKVRANTKKKEDEKQKWYQGYFQKGALGEKNGVAKSILGTTSDLLSDIGAGFLDFGESAVDFFASNSDVFYNAMVNQQSEGVMSVKQRKMHDQIAEETKKAGTEFAKKDLYDGEEVAKKILSGLYSSANIAYKTQNGMQVTQEDIQYAKKAQAAAQKYLDEEMEGDSVLGDKSDAIAQSFGHRLATTAVSALSMGTIPWWASYGVTTYGSEMENALQNGATVTEARGSALISAGAEIFSESLFAGSGLGEKGLINLAPITAGISNKAAKAVFDYLVDMGAEGGEEVFSQVMSRLGSALYREENLQEILFSEEAFEEYIQSFISGSAMSGLMNSPKVVTNIANKTDSRYGLSQNEQKVVDHEYKNRLAELEEEKKRKLNFREKSKLMEDVIQDMDKGIISTDTIEAVLGGETYNQFKNAYDQELSMQTEFDTLSKEYDELYNMKNGEKSSKQTDREAELKAKLPQMKQNLANVRANSTLGDMKIKLSEEVFGLAKDSRLAESYNERTRRGQAFEADLSQYDVKQRQVVQRAIDSGILNDTNRTHELVDFVAKISADKGVLFDFTNNEKLKNSGFAVEGKQVNGYVTKDGVTLNIDSAKALESTVGHEITHVLEGSEFYNSLKETIFEYARAKGEYQTRYDALSKLYQNVKDADVEKELVADLVGDYLFKGSDFAVNLSVQDKNIFERIYDEIKYLCKVVTAGSKEARRLEAVKHEFEKVYRESAKAQTDTKYSVSETTDGRPVAVVDNDILSNVDTSTWDKTTKKQVQKAASEELKKFSDGFTINGIEFVGNKDSRREYTGSNYSEALARKNPAAYLDKMRAAAVLDDVISVATDWSNDGYLKHGREDYVDFVRGKTLIMSGDRTYRAVVLAGITGDGKAIFHDVEDVYPEAFEIKKSESATTVSANESPNSILADSDGANVAQNGDDVKYSVSNPTKNLDAIKAEYKDKTDYLFLHEKNDGTISLDNMVIKKEYRNQGIGTQILNDVIAYADANGKTITLTPTTEFGTKSRLTKWYKANGFVENKGKNADYRLSDTMYRLPRSAKYSLSDSDGKQLTKEQQEYFKDSKMRDEKGNLMVLYHGTQADFTVFDLTRSGENYDGWSEYGQGIYVTPDKKAAQYYADNAGRGRDTHLMELYANVRKPFNTLEAVEFDISEYVKKYELTEFDERFIKGAGYRLIEFLNTHNESVYECLSANGYDGIWDKDSSGYVHQVVVFEENQLKNTTNLKPTEDVDIRYSLSDSEGRNLTNEQVAYFQDSKARDDNGNLKVVYHGTRNADFTVFKRNVNFFTDSKEMADSYSPNGDMYEGYVNIKKPYEIDAKGEKWSKIPIDVATKDFLQEYGASVFKEGGKWRTTPADLAAAIEEAIDNGDMDYDGIIIRNVDDTGSYYKGNSKHIATDYIVFNSNQFKNADNKAPTTDKDIRFSLSEPVEETKELMALHNLTEEKLLKSLRMGGLPMPSVAIAKAKDGHGEFGEISLVLPRETIDPEASRRNKLYSGDAWTPTYPKVEYKPSDKVLSNVRNKINTLVPYEVQDALGHLGLDADNARDYLARYDGNMVEAYNRNDAMKYAYLKDTGSDITLPMKEEDLVRYGEISNSAVRYFSGKLVNGLQTVEHYQNMGASDMLRDNALTEAVADALNFDVLRTLEPGSPEYMEYERNPVFLADEVTFRDIDRLLSACRKLFTNGVQQTVDRRAAKELVRDAVDQAAYENWLGNLFEGVVEKEGIRNNKDYFTPSGNPRSFEALHYEHNLENVIKAMREQGEKGIAFGGGSIFGAATTEFSSVEEMKRSSDRLQQMPEEEYQRLRDGFTNRFFELASSLPNDKKSFIATDDAANTLVEAVSKYSTRSGIANYLRRELKGWATYSSAVVDDLIELVNDIRKMPTGYFEAKPQRAVGFEEVGVFVIPNNADIKLKQELLNRGYSIAEYDPNVEGDRQRVVNQFEEYKFSLSDASQVPQESGYRATLGKDIALAPTAEETQVVAENAPTASEVETIEFPDDLAPVQDELDELLAEEEGIRNIMDTYASVGDIDAVNRLLADHEAIQERIRELQQPETDRVNSLSDADAPGETEAPVFLESKNYDPYEGVSVHDISRSTRSYSDLNPGARHFLEEAALGFAYDVNNSTHGEKWYNDELYYASGGEKGFGGTKRHTTSDIEDLKDTYGYTWDDLRKAAEDVAKGEFRSVAAKRVEYLCHKRLMEGYTDIDGRRYEPNQEYISFLNETFANEQRIGSIDNLLENADLYAPEDFAPVKPLAAATPDTIQAPVYDSKEPGTVKGQTSMFEPEQQAESAPATRKELHHSIVEGIKSVFSGKGLDFDKVLKKAKNLSTFATVDNTPQRVMEKALGYKEGGVLADLTVNKVAQNESEKIKWLNSFTGKDGLLRQISKQYHIRPGSKASAAAQMYAEGFYVAENNDIIAYGDAELAQDFPNEKVRNNIKGLARDPRIRQIYDETLNAINESRTRNLYPKIPRLDNYFLHFRAQTDTFSRLGLPFNPNDIRAKDLPTDLNGVTADLKPGQPYFASALHREGKRTSFDLLGGLEKYLTSAANQIYHIDDIQTLRALRNYIADTYGQANGLEGLDALSEDEAQERIKQVYGSHLSTFAKFLNEEANVLAGKTALIDRGLEGIIGRRGITFLNTLNQQVGANMVGWNVSSSLTNFLPVAQTFAKTNKFDFVKAFAQTVASKFGMKDGFAEDSPVVIRRKGADRFYRTPWQKLADPGYALMGMVDDISTELIARTKYNEFTRKGMDSQQAHFETDKWVSKLMGDRSLGQQPQMFNSKMLGLVTKFQLEVRNQLDAQFYDTIQEAKASNEHIENNLARNARTAAKVTSTFLQLAVVQHLFGKAFETVAGYNPAFDIIEVLMTAFGYDDDEESEDTALDNIEQAVFALMEDMPYASTFMDGGRIPISEALPIQQLVKGEDEYGNEKSRWETLGEIAPYYAMPGGYGQLKKSIGGLKMFSDEHPVAGSYTDSGNLRFTVEDTPANRIKAGVFGQWANENARKYFDGEQRTLNPEQTEILAGLDIPIEDYWEYRDNLYAFYDVKDQLKEKAFADNATDRDVLSYTYINNVYGDVYDLYDRQKEIASGDSEDKRSELRKLQSQMEQMLSQSNNALKNLSVKGLYAEVGGKRYNKNAESGKWYEIRKKNSDGSDNKFYQMEQKVTKALGISYSQYWNNRDEYDFAYENPERYALAQSVGGYKAYKQYTSDLYKFEADKDENGDSIPYSKKNKIIEYINNLDLDYGERIILFRTMYDSKADKEAYNMDIVNYLNSRDDIDYYEMVTILKYLGFTVDSEGNIYWD